MATYSSNIYINNSKFSNNWAKNWAGGILVKDYSVLHVLGGENEFDKNTCNNNYCKNSNCQSICRGGNTTGSITSQVFFDICPPNKWYNENLVPTGASVTKGIGIDFEGCPQTCSLTSETVALGFAARSGTNQNEFWTKSTIQLGLLQ